jgi:hypothetical protein
MFDVFSVLSVPLCFKNDLGNAYQWFESSLIIKTCGQPNLVRLLKS